VTANAAFTRDALEAVGGFDERFPGAAGEDTDLTFRIQDQNMRVTLIEGASVAHDHRTSIRGVFRTYYRHGRAWLILAHTHPDRELGTRSTSMATAGYWRERYEYYRDEHASRGAAVVYCGLRLVGLTCFATGMAREALEERRSARR
jgi:GT2 family glycosyltransferase